MLLQSGLGEKDRGEDGAGANAGSWPSEPKPSAKLRRWDAAVSAKGLPGLVDSVAVLGGHRLVIDWSGEQSAEHRVARNRTEQSLRSSKLALREHVDDVVKFRTAGH